MLKSAIKNLKIKYKVFLSFFILILLVVVVLLLSVYHLEKEAVLIEVRDRITGLSEILAYSSVKAILSEDFLELQGLIESIKRKEDVLEVSLFSKEGRILSSTNAEIINSFLNKETLEVIKSKSGNYLQYGFLNKDEPYLVSISPVYSIEDILGYASIKVSLVRA